MPEQAKRFDPELVRQQWDYGSDAYDHAQQTGEDVYRYAFFGPAQVALCGNVSGLTVLDLGCGAGYFSREMAARGALVTGIDISRNQVERARKHEANKAMGIHYLVMDAAAAAAHFEPGSFDLVTACLSLQDMPDAEKVIRGAFALLKAGGRFVFSITHPCTDTPHREWERDGEGRKLSLKIDRYFERVPMEYHWRSPGHKYGWKTTAIHATLSDWVRWTLKAGFCIRSLEEPRPSEQTVRQHPQLEDSYRLPYFLMLDLERPAG